MAFILEYRGVFRTISRSGPTIRNVRLPRAFVACALALGATAAPPAAATSDFLADTTERGSAGWGIATRFEQSPYRGGGVRIDLLPLYLYEGEYVYLHSYRAGLKLDFGSGKRAAAFLSHRSESFPVERVPASLAGMSTRVPGTDFGLSYEQRFDWGHGFVEVLHDVSNNSGGTEWRLGAATEWWRGRLMLAPYFMLSARDARLNNYYYGVNDSEAAADRPAYRPGGGLNGSIGLNARYDLTDTWHFFAGASATLWASGVRKSPIVDDRVQLAAYGGLAY
jgi:outer membrane protein